MRGGGGETGRGRELSREGARQTVRLSWSLSEGVGVVRRARLEPEARGVSCPLQPGRAVQGATAAGCAVASANGRPWPVYLCIDWGYYLKVDFGCREGRTVPALPSCKRVLRSLRPQ
jgi:hypothetical protein